MWRSIIRTEILTMNWCLRERIKGAAQYLRRTDRLSSSNEASELSSESSK